MLAIRMQRTGRKGHAQFRVVVQDSRWAPSSGKFVAHVGNYNPHTKTANLEKDRIERYLKNGAQPSDRAALLFKREGIKLPKWVSVDTKKQAKPRNPEKLRANQPEGAKPEAAQADETELATSDATEVEAEPSTAEADQATEVTTVEAPAEESAAKPETEASDDK